MVLVDYGLGFFLVQGYRIPMFIVIRRKQDVLSFGLRKGHRREGMGNRYRERERGCGYVVNCGFGGADGVLHTMSGSWGPTAFRVSPGLSQHQSAIRLIVIVPQHCTTNLKLYN